MNCCSLGFQSIPTGSMSHYFNVAKGQLARVPMKPCEGTGIIIAGGGKYEAWALANVVNTRRINRDIPIEVWCMSPDEIRDPGAFQARGARVIAATEFLPRHPMRQFKPWALKAYALIHSQLRNVLFLDADCFVQPAGVELVHHLDFVKMGAIFFPDVKRCHASPLAFHAAGLKAPWEIGAQEFETGQFLVDKQRHWHALQLANWMHSHSDCWWRSLHGDKGSTEIAFRAVGKPYGFGTSSWGGLGDSAPLQRGRLLSALAGSEARRGEDAGLVFQQLRIVFGSPVHTRAVARGVRFRV